MCAMRGDSAAARDGATHPDFGAPSPEGSGVTARSRGSAPGLRRMSLIGREPCGSATRGMGECNGNAQDGRYDRNARRHGECLSGVGPGTALGHREHAPSTPEEGWNHARCLRSRPRASAKTPQRGRRRPGPLQLDPRRGQLELSSSELLQPTGETPAPPAAPYPYKPVEGTTFKVSSTLRQRHGGGLWRAWLCGNGESLISAHLEERQTSRSRQCSPCSAQ